jgi:hypothetical protein
MCQCARPAPALVACLIALAAGSVLAQPATGPLSVSSANPRYFADTTGRIVYLTGSHTWLNFQDSGGAFPPPAFDYTAYLDWLTARHHNFFRLWLWEEARWTSETSDNNYWFNPGPPYQRTGPGNALDGHLRFDVTKLEQAYFDRLRQRAQDAGNRGFYVSVMLFDGWSVANLGGQMNPWMGHPFNSANNINGTNGDPNGTGDGQEIHTLDHAAITTLQDAYVRKVVDTVNDLDNVLYEICNECNSGSETWQYHVINLIKSYELTKPKRHPVGMTVEWPGGDNGELFASPADWVSPNSDYAATPLTSAPSKVILSDTDHVCGVCKDGDWVWRSFMNGVNPIFMDVYDGAGYGTGAAGRDPNAPEAIAARRAMGQTRTFADRVPLAGMRPQPTLSSTGFAQAGGSAYLAYRPSGSANLTLNLTSTPGTLAFQWLNVATDTIVAGGSVMGGASRVFSPPFSGPAVLYVNTTVPVELQSFSVQ